MLQNQKVAFLKGSSTHTNIPAGKENGSGVMLLPVCSPQDGTWQPCQQYLAAVCSPGR